MSQFVIDEENPHLGGACVGGDPATFYPELWTWLVEEYGVRSVIDVGCGEGHAAHFFRSLLPADDREHDGWWRTVVAIDGIAVDDPLITVHDYTTGPFETREISRTGVTYTGRIYDLCWSCEFVEHVRECYLPNFLATFACADLVLMTHASPGQPGYHHVNCRDAEYWKGAMAAIGYAYDEILTATTRELARANTDPHNHYVRSGLAFERQE